MAEVQLDQPKSLVGPTTWSVEVKIKLKKVKRFY
jgi:hypothetical protein